MANVKAIPEGYTTVTAALTFRDADKAIDFYKRALGATERGRSVGPDGKIMHAEVKIGTSIIMLNDEMMGCQSAETAGASPVTFYLYVEDADAAFQKAVSEGGKPLMPVSEMFWGDRIGQIQDPFGYRWSVATHVKDLTPDEIKRGQDEFMKQMGAAH